MANIPVTEISRFLNLNDNELEVEQGATATITAQLKANERTFLQQRSDLRARLTVPPSADDDEVQQELLRVTGDIQDNEEQINRNNAIVTLIAKLRSVRPTGAGGTPPTGRASTPPASTGAGGGGGTTSPLATAAGGGGAGVPSTPTPAPALPYRQIFGKLPEYKLTDQDFDVFLSRFETYCSLNKITDQQHSKLLLDSALSEEAKLRASEISALYEPYKSESFSAYSQRLRDRFYPQAKATLYKNTYDTIKQKANQSVADYCSTKFASYRKAYLGYPFQFLVRTLVQNLHNEDLKSEILRQVGTLEHSTVTEAIPQQRLYGDLMNVINNALDLCRRTSSSPPEVLDRNGLKVEGKDLPASATPTVSIAQMGEQEEENYCEWPQPEEEEGIYVADEMDDYEEIALTEEEVNYCYLNETEAQSQYWERKPSQEEILQIQNSPTGRRCHECNSNSHLVRNCPVRLRLVQSRTQQICNQSGRSPYPTRGIRGWRGRGGGATGMSSWRSRGQMGRGGRPRGRASSWTPRVPLPQGFQNPYQPGQPASRMGPSTSFPGSDRFR